jgi:hypothetical protein
VDPRDLGAAVEALKKNEGEEGRRKEKRRGRGEEIRGRRGGRRKGLTYSCPEDETLLSLMLPTSRPKGGRDSRGSTGDVLDVETGLDSGISGVVGTNDGNFLSGKAVLGFEAAGGRVRKIFSSRSSIFLSLLFSFLSIRSSLVFSSWSLFCSWNLSLLIPPSSCSSLPSSYLKSEGS